MNFNQMVIREYLKHNPTLQEAPEVLRLEYKDGAARGIMRWRNLPDANLYGTAFYNYEIPDLGVLFSGLTITLRVWKPTTHRDVAKVLFDTYGVIANLNDIVPTAMSFNPLPDYVDLTTVAGSTSLKGKLRVYTLPKVMPLDELITVQDVDAVKDDYPLSIANLQVIKKYYGYDFTDQRMYLSTIREGNYIYQNIDVDGVLYLLPNLPTVIDEMDGPTWMYRGQTTEDFNGAYIRAAYNGVTSAQPLANKAYTHVLICDSNNSYKASGKFYFHYNM